MLKIVTNILMVLMLMGSGLFAGSKTVSTGGDDSKSKKSTKQAQKSSSAQVGDVLWKAGEKPIKVKEEEMPVVDGKVVAKFTGPKFEGCMAFPNFPENFADKESLIVRMGVDRSDDEKVNVIVQVIGESGGKFKIKLNDMHGPEKFNGDVVNFEIPIEKIMAEIGSAPKNMMFGLYIHEGEKNVTLYIESISVK
jgi:hypothetical protein